MLIADGNGNFIETPIPTGDINGEGISTHSSIIQFTEPTPTPQPKGNSLGWLFWVLVVLVIGIIGVKYFFSKKIKNETVAKKRT